MEHERFGLQSQDLLKHPYCLVEAILQGNWLFPSLQWMAVGKTLSATIVLSHAKVAALLFQEWDGKLRLRGWKDIGHS